MNKKLLGNALAGTSSILLSLAMIGSIGYSIADKWRSSVDDALGTTSWITKTDDPKYVSDYKTGKELMDAAKALSVREGAEGTVIMKNNDNVFPLQKNKKVALFGAASYHSYYSKAGNTDTVDLPSALKKAGFNINEDLEDIYLNHILAEYTETSGGWGGPKKTYVWDPNFSAGDYTTFKVNELAPSRFTEEGLLKNPIAADWEDKAKSDIAIVTFARPGGEGTTYKPGSALDTNGNPTGKNPLALSDDELAVVDTAKRLCGKVVVLLNTSCTIEVGPLVKGEHAVDGIAYIGIPNDYQFTGIVQALDGTVNPTGALADTYAFDSTSSPAMMNFGGDYYSDYTLVNEGYDDPRWPGAEIGNNVTGSFGGSASYSGGYYIVEAEGIYTGYNYYETRYYDSIANPTYKANSSKGVTQGESGWKYEDEVAYPFGYGLSYIDYEQKITNIIVEDKANGNITATIAVTNKGDKDGKFLASLYVQTPYTDYDRQYKVEKSAIQFLSSEKVDVKAGQTENIQITVPTKYMASYDYTHAKTYIMDGGTYYFTTGNGSHDAVNNVLKAQKKLEGEAPMVKTWFKSGATDTTTYAVSESGAKITNTSDNIDLNYYLPGTVTYLSRQDWDATYPVNYNTVNNGKGVSLAASPKKDEWINELRNNQYTIKKDGTVENYDGKAGPKFNAESVGYDQQSNINDEYWDDLVNAIPANEAIGAVAHGGSQSDTLTNIENPVVKQNDGPNGFNGKTLSTNNGENAEEDIYFVDPESEEGKFKACINSQTLLGSAFSPKLAYDWGRLLGNTGLWIKNYQIWGAALNYHRSPYNGRNTEYPSEDPMLCNILGREITKGTREMGIISGPKHIGFNDQEHDRSGICVYMNEQKMRETDLRGFQGAVEEGEALGLMVAFNRLGAINASHHVGFLQDIVRHEWNFQGLISTDMMNNKYYFNPESAIMASVTQMADFAGNNSNINLGKDKVHDATWGYLSIDATKNDPALVDAAREAMKYQLYAFANSAVLNISTERVVPYWETAIKAIEYTTLGLGCVTLGGYFGVAVLSFKKKEI